VVVNVFPPDERRVNNLWRLWGDPAQRIAQGS